MAHLNQVQLQNLLENLLETQGRLERRVSELEDFVTVPDITDNFPQLEAMLQKMGEKPKAAKMWHEDIPNTTDEQYMQVSDIPWVKAYQKKYGVRKVNCTIGQKLTYMGRKAGKPPYMVKPGTPYVHSTAIISTLKHGMDTNAIQLFRE